MFRTIHASAHDIPLPDASVQVVVTSPPFFGLRRYSGDQAVEWPAVTYAPMPGLPTVTVTGCDPACDHEWTDQPGKAGKVTHGTGNSTLTGGHESWGNRDGGTQGAYCAKCGGWRGDLGLEPDPIAYIGHLILCLREWRRILRDDGTVFVNLGDSYASSGVQDHGAHKGLSAASERADGHPRNAANKAAQNGSIAKTNRTVPSGLKPKDLVGIPWRFAFAAQAEGWWLRSDIIWAKPNPMPESVTDRCTKSHEYVFLLAKAQRYFWDADAVREAAEYGRREWSKDGNSIYKASVGDKDKNPGRGSYTVTGGDGSTGRNLRSVWFIPTSPFAGSHFATFPPKLVEPCIKAGSSARGACPNCGAPWRRVVERSTDIHNDKEGAAQRLRCAGVINGGTDKVTLGVTQHVRREDKGWEPTCQCAPAEPVPCVVCDPFGGSNTTGVVAVRLGRAYVGVDISEQYLGEITDKRVGGGLQIGIGL